MKYRLLIPIAAFFTLAASGICQAYETDWSRGSGHGPFLEQKDRAHGGYDRAVSAAWDLNAPMSTRPDVGDEEKAQEAIWTRTLAVETVLPDLSRPGFQIVRLSETKTGEGNVKPYSAA